MKSGWIKLYRQIMECEVLWDSSEEPFDRRSAWIDLLLMANHRDKRTIFKGKAVTVKSGQRITSLHKLSERWHWGINRVRNFLDLLQNEEMIVRESDNTKTLITIVNYQKYQGFEDSDKSPTDTVTDTPTDTVTDIAQIQSQIPNKNIKKNEKEIKKEFGLHKNVRLTEEEKNKLCQELGDDKAFQCVNFLDSYIAEKGYKSKSHYLTIKRWVVDAVNEENQRRKGNKGNKFSDIPKSGYDIEDLEAKLLSMEVKK